jgi:hypothetical protein
MRDVPRILFSLSNRIGSHAECVLRSVEVGSTGEKPTARTSRSPWLPCLGYQGRQPLVMVCYTGA